MAQNMAEETLLILKDSLKVLAGFKMKNDEKIGNYNDSMFNSSETNRKESKNGYTD
jgi:hypothetical protein